MSIPGIDLSNHQPNVNWQNLADAGIKFGLFKASESITFKDSTFASKWTGSKNVGILRGAYHFFRCTRDGIEQANNFLDVLNSAGGMESNDLPPVLDIEIADGVGSQLIKQRCLQWLQRVEQQTGRKPMIYTSPGFWGGLGSTSAFTSYPLWVAHYRLGRPNIPGNWSTCAIWQYTDKSKVKGVFDSSNRLVNVDLNWFNGTLEALQAFATEDTSQIRTDAIFANLINRGDSGDEVKEVQQLLMNKGFNLDPFGADGDFGSLTEAAIVRFQTDNNLPINGIVDPATLATLRT